MRGILPSPEDIFVAEYFKEPLFMVQILHDLEKIYGFAEVPDQLMGKLIRSKFDQTNSILQTHIWFAFFMFPDTEFVEAVVNRYRSGPGSSIPFLRSKARGQHPNQENNVDDEVTTVLGSPSNSTTRRITRSQGVSPHHDHMEDEDVTSKKLSLIHI